MTTKAAHTPGRIAAGLQCPECSGVRITARQTRFEASPSGWICEECGCQWPRPLAAIAKHTPGRDDGLIRAAQALLDASGHISPFGGESSVQAVRRAGKYVKAVENLRAAIAKATGGA